MRLEEYRQKRDFAQTPEPKGKVQKSPSGRMFVVHKHAARRLHYDLRLELEGVLKSWAVPKGPSCDPAEKRLAVEVEDHPIDYGDFEGTIEPPQYGAGTVMVWDRGTWEPVGDPKKTLDAGKFKFTLHGEKLRGGWTPVRIRGGREEKQNWLWIKERDGEARSASEYDVGREERSVKTGRSMEEIRAHRDESAAWVSNAPAKKGAWQVPKAAQDPQAGRRAPMPASLAPQLATLVSEVPKGKDWLHEIKFDGYRLLPRIRDGKVRLMTRRGQDWTEKFAPIAEELSRLPVENAILDGEVVVQNPDGSTDFQKLQNYLKNRGKVTLVYYAFDLPYLNYHDLSEVPLRERKATLHELLRAYQDRMPLIQYSDHVEGSGERVFQAACERGAEGIVSKKADSSYAQTRTKNWVKVKCVQRQEFVVGGYTNPQGSRGYFGSLLLGYYDGKGRLTYCGNVGTGFNAQSLRTLYERLKELEQDRSPFAAPVKGQRPREVHWTSPQMVVDVKFTSWTDDGHLRHPSFVGMREDKDPREVIRERPAPPPAEEPRTQRRPAAAAKDEKPKVPSPPPVRVTHENKVLYPDSGLTKGDLVEYYRQIEEWIMPELAGRPLTLVRCPEGVEKECFFQKHLGDEKPEAIQTVAIEEKEQAGIYPVVEDLHGLLSLVQLDVLEIHVWGSRREHLEFPDRMVLDLDPSPELPKKTLVEGARYLREWLLREKIKPYFKTTGGKGIHVVVALKPALDWDQVKEIARNISLEMERQKPDLFLSTQAKRMRKGKIYLDYLRNSRGATSILPYSTRARPGAPIALPFTDRELNEDFLSRPWTLKEALQRLKRLKKDPWEGMH